MFFNIDGSLLNNEAWYKKLDEILALTEDGKHDLFIPNGQEDDIMESGWVKSLGERHIDIVISLIQKSITRTAYIGNVTIKSKNIVTIDSSEEGERIYYQLVKPLFIVLEDIGSDKLFLESVLPLFKKQAKGILAGIENGWIEFCHAGGKTQIPKICLSKLHKKLMPRFFVIIDSDKEFPTQPYSKEIQTIQTFCNQNNIPYHILHKREIENYLTETLLIKRVPNEAQKIVKSFLQLSPEQKDFYDLEKGIKDNANALYDNLDPAELRILKKGFSEIKTFDSKKEMYQYFSDPDFTRMDLDQKCAHQPDPEEVKNLILEINKFI